MISEWKTAAGSSDRVSEIVQWCRQVDFWPKSPKNDQLGHVTELKELVKTKEMIPHLLLLLLLFDGGSTTNCNQRVSSKFQQILNSTCFLSRIPLVRSRSHFVILWQRFLVSTSPQWNSPHRGRIKSQHTLSFKQQRLKMWNQATMRLQARTQSRLTMPLQHKSVPPTLVTPTTTRQLLDRKVVSLWLELRTAMFFWMLPRAWSTWRRTFSALSLPLLSATEVARVSLVVSRFVPAMVLLVRRHKRAMAFQRQHLWQAMVHQKQLPKQDMAFLKQHHWTAMALQKQHHWTAMALQKQHHRQDMELQKQHLSWSSWFLLPRQWSFSPNIEFR